MKEKILQHEGRTFSLQYDLGESGYSVDFKIWHAERDFSTATESVDYTLFYIDESGITSPSYKDASNEATPFMIGHLKWDGCVDIDFPDIRDCMLHFCGPEEEPELGFLMKEVYKLGPEIEHWRYQQ